MFVIAKSHLLEKCSVRYKGVLPKGLLHFLLSRIFSFHFIQRKSLMLRHRLLQYYITKSIQPQNSYHSTQPERYISDLLVTRDCDVTQSGRDRSLLSSSSLSD